MLLLCSSIASTNLLAFSASLTYYNIIEMHPYKKDQTRKISKFETLRIVKIAMKILTIFYLF